MKNIVAKKIVMLSSLFLFNELYAQAPETIFEILGGGAGIRTWVYVGGDEFDGDTLDYTKWHNSHNGERAGCSGGVVDNCMYTNGNNLQVIGGDLRIIADDIPVTARAIDYQPDSYVLCDGGPNLRTFPYTGGEIYSNQKFRYGLFQCRFTAPVGTGLWPAFWLFGPGNEEIDCFELKGERTNEIHYDLHNYYYWSSHISGEVEPGGWINVGTNLTTSSHEIMCIWEPGLVLWYIDNVFITYENVDFYNSMNIIVNLATASSTNWPPGPDGTTPFPAIFNIDYVRAYSALDCNADDVPFCNYTAVNFHDLALVGTELHTGTVGSTPDCASGSNITVTSGHSFKMIANEHIIIGENFTAEEGSYFEAKIMECWEDRSYEPGSYLNLVTDTSFYSRTNPKTNSSKIIEDGLKVYPNPASFSVTVSSNENDLIQNIKLYDVLGTLIKEFNFANLKDAQINLLDMAKGLYIIETKTQSNSCKKTLIIQ